MKVWKHLRQAIGLWMTVVAWLYFTAPAVAFECPKFSSHFVTLDEMIPLTFKSIEEAVEDILDGFSSKERAPGEIQLLDSEGRLLYLLKVKSIRSQDKSLLSIVWDLQEIQETSLVKFQFEIRGQDLPLPDVAELARGKLPFLNISGESGSSAMDLSYKSHVILTSRFHRAREQWNGKPLRRETYRFWIDDDGEVFSAEDVCTEERRILRYAHVAMFPEVKRSRFEVTKILGRGKVVGTEKLTVNDEAVGLQEYLKYLDSAVGLFTLGIHHWLEGALHLSSFESPGTGHSKKSD